MADIQEEDLEIRLQSTKPVTGMHHNGVYPTYVAVQHIPSGTIVSVCSERSQIQNKRLALVGLHAILDDVS